VLYFSLVAPAICYLFFLHIVLYVFLANKWWWWKATPLTTTLLNHGAVVLPLFFDVITKTSASVPPTFQCSCLWRHYALPALQSVLQVGTGNGDFDFHFPFFRQSGGNGSEYFFYIELPSVQLQRRFEKFSANAADDDKVY